MKSLKNLDHVSIALASPERIKSWSFGEVVKPETVDYRTNRPKKDGLFCEKIFGPVKDMDCSSGCPKKKKGRKMGEICPNCGVEITKSAVRRERMGHIDLQTPVAHYWFFGGLETYIATLLDIPRKVLKNVIYCAYHIVTDPGDTEFEEKQVLRTREYEAAKKKYGNRFRAETGGEGIRTLLEKIDLDIMSAEVQEKIDEMPRKNQAYKNLVKKLQVVESFRQSGNRPEWMIMTVLPIIPPNLRPMILLSGGRPAATDLNNLYRAVINRNNRLKKFLEERAPEVIIINEKRMLQEAVDELFSSKAAKSGRNKKKPLKSLQALLEGKHGRFRQNLLGKRVDFSGRSVIAVGPDLKMEEIGLPKKMALELFKPYVLRELVRTNIANSVPHAKRLIDGKNEDIWPILDKVAEGRPVILNRAPTLHKLSIRAFVPRIIEGEAIRLHPLACGGYNADFDGDQMAVHLPLSFEAQSEARRLLFSPQNLLHPQNGEPAATPSQDMVLGSYYISMEEESAKGEGKFFRGFDEVIKEYEFGRVDLHAKVFIKARENFSLSDGKYLMTTPGKILFNRVLPDGFPYVNDADMESIGKSGFFHKAFEAKGMLEKEKTKPFGKGFVKDVINYAIEIFGKEASSTMLDGMKDLGFEFATKGGLTISLYDVETPEEKEDILKKTDVYVEELTGFHEIGQISDKERYEAVVEAWTETSEKVANAAVEKLYQNPFNPILMMMDSKARGSVNQFKQLAGMRGPMADPSGATIEQPIRSNFSEGLSVYEYFISTHGARKGQADTSLKTADAGYLTRRMVEVSKDVVVTEENCETEDYLVVKAIEPSIETLEKRLIGRYIGANTYSRDGELLAVRDDYVGSKLAKKLDKECEEVPIRSLLTCSCKRGVCKKCYGMNMSSHEVVNIGEAVGIIAAQSIGEPGTQLTMRTFHTGGVAGADITQGLPRVEQIFEARKLESDKVQKAELSLEDGYVKAIDSDNKTKVVIIENDDGEVKEYNIPYGQTTRVTVGEKVNKGDALSNAPISPHELLRLKTLRDVQVYLLEEVQRVYASQGVAIADKHIETVIRQMSRKLIVTNPGDAEGMTIGQPVDRFKMKEINEGLINDGKLPVEYEEVMQGITSASQSVESFLSTASFQETSKALTSAAVKGKKDYIKGIKESVILGKLIPAGTGMKKYRE